MTDQAPPTTAALVEEIARAICNTFTREGNDYANFAEPFKGCWRDAARAALATSTLAQPTAEQIGRANELWSYIRQRFMDHADRYRNATTYEEASIIADSAARDYTEAAERLLASRPPATPQEQKQCDLCDTAGRCTYACAVPR